jgi:hypothetical protein
MKQKGWLYIGLFGGTGFAQLVVNAVAAWAPAYLERTFALTAELAGYRFGFAQVFAAVGGTFFMPMLFRWLASTGRTVIASRLPALISIAGALCVAASPFFGGSWGFLGGIAVGGFLLLGVANMTILILQPLVPAQMRATITAVGLIGVTGFGLGLGPVLAAVINSVAEETANPLGWGIAGVALVGMVGASFFYALAANRFASAMAGENQAPA